MQNSRNTYYSKDINAALCEIAKNKGRYEPYSVIIRREVLQAINENKDHHLKAEVLDVLGSIAPLNQIDEENLQGILKSNHDLSDMNLAQIKVIDDWCADRHGRYVELSNIMGIKSLRLRRCLSLVTTPTADEVNKMYEIVKQLELKETYGVHECLGSRTNERFFTFVLRSFVNYAIDSAQKHLTQDLLSVEDSFSCFFNYGFSFSNYQNFTIYHRKRLAHKLKSLGLLSQLYKNAGNPSRYMLRDQEFAQKVFLSALEELQTYIACGLNINGYSVQRKRISQSGKVEKVKQHLKRMCYERYHISEECIRSYFPDDLVLFSS